MLIPASANGMFYGQAVSSGSKEFFRSRKNESRPHGYERSSKPSTNRGMSLMIT